MMYKLGVDVGGTNTDAVLIDENLQVVADIKYPTSGDVYEGILCAVREVLRVSGIDKTKIRQAMLGTTQCTNAIVERKIWRPSAFSGWVRRPQWPSVPCWTGQRISKGSP